MRDILVRIMRWWSVVLILLCSPALAASGGECQVVKWVELSPGLHFCVTSTSSSAQVAVVAVDLARTDLEVAGTRADGKPPTLQDVDRVEGAGESSEFSLQSVIERGAAADLLISAGYPESAKSFVIDGLLRMDGEDLSERDASADFKSAMFCLSELDGVRGGGSVPVIFNAFEDGAPIELNPRVLNRTSCRDVIQVGPRIIEYRGKEGISIQATRRTPQRYLAFAVGGGPRYMGYFMATIDDVTLYAVQETLVDIAQWSGFDDETVVAVTLAAGAYAGMAVRDAAGQLLPAGSRQGDYHVVGTVNAPIGAVIVADIAP